MSARIYSVLLSLYPADLRHAFGAEMTEVFLEDLKDSRRRSGHRGAVRVWWSSIKELCRIVLPVEASRREIAVPFIMYVLQFIYVGCICLVERGRPDRDLPSSPAQMLLLAMVISLVPAFIAFVALRVGNRSVPVPLDLSHK